MAPTSDPALVPFGAVARRQAPEVQDSIVQGLPSSVQRAPAQQGWPPSPQGWHTPCWQANPLWQVLFAQQLCPSAPH